MKQSSADILKKYGAVPVDENSNALSISPESQKILVKYGATPISGFEDENQEFSEEIQGLMSKYGAVPVDASNSIKNSQPAEYSYGERAGQVARGAAKTYGGMADLITEGGQALSKPVEGTLRDKLSKISAIPLKEENNDKPEFSRGLTESVDKLYGRDLSPTDKTGKFLEGVGEFAAPLPVPGVGPAAAIGKGAKSIGKAIAKEAGGAVGASATLNLTPNLTEEGSASRTIEDLAKVIIGAHGGSGLGGNPGKIISGPKKIAKDIAGIPARILSLGSRPNKEILELAKKRGIDLPFNIGSESRPQNFLANNYLKSMFVSDVYKDVVKKADEQMVGAVKKSINTLGDVDTLPSTASKEYSNFLKIEEDALEKHADTLYEEASKLLKDSDKVKPKNTAEFIYSLKELFNRDIQSTATKNVAGIIEKLGEKWGITPSKSVKIAGEEVSSNPELMNSILESFKKELPEIPLEKLIGVKKELGRITKYDKDLKGVENYLNGLIGNIAKDIESSPNKAFTNKLQESNKFFKQNIADRFRGDLARSLMTGEAPVEAFSKMNSVENIRLLKKISGDTPKGKEIYDQLAKAKVRDIFQNALKDESLQVGSFANLFKKKERSAEIIKELMGEAEFNQLSEIAEIAQSFSKAGRDVLNTSGTAIAHSDISKINQLLKNSLLLISGGAGYAVGGLAGAAVAAVAPNVLSRLVSNKKFINQMHSYALARQAGKEKEAKTILKRVFNIVKEIEPETAERTLRYGTILENND